MTARPSIRRRRDARLHSAAFWLLLVLAVAVGGMRALEGAPALLQMLVPPGLLAAEAQSVAQPRVALPLTERFPVSPYSPQWLTPVEAGSMPDWLAARLSAGQGGAAPVAATTPSHAPVIAPKIAIVIDDLGADVVGTKRAIALPAAVSLSFLPYPDTTPELVREGVRGGHQILVHVPMEPDGAADPGPNALRIGLPREELSRRLDWDLSRVPGFSGINNHEGSRFTADRTALVPVVEALADRHVFFLDSRTTVNSQVVPVARAFGVPSAARDVFLDDDQSPQAIAAALAQTEALAKRDGVVIAIGHPHQATLDALTRWVAGRKDLVPVAVAIRLKTEREVAQK
ncbi:MAG TPA: divergent polysaccharide deacetylase family protein [Rhizomicrobium sp.]|jgi:hypothetical protein